MLEFEDVAPTMVWMPKNLSVIIPVLNEEDFIVETLKDLIPFRALGAEVIVVDGGSQDNTVALAIPLVDKLLSSDKGRANQMNLGAAHARGDILLFLHADTSLPAEGIGLMLVKLKNPKFSWGFFNVSILGASSMFSIIAALMNFRSCFTGIATGDQAIFVLRQEFMAIKGFPIQPLMEDVELSHRLGKRSKPLCLKQKARTSGRRWQLNGVWRTIRLMWLLRLLYWLGVPAEKLAKAYQ